MALTFFEFSLSVALSLILSLIHSLSFSPSLSLLCGREVINPYFIAGEFLSLHRADSSRVFRPCTDQAQSSSASSPPLHLYLHLALITEKALRERDHHTITPREREGEGGMEGGRGEERSQGEDEGGGRKKG